MPVVIEREFERDCQKRLVHRFEADQPFPRSLHAFLRPFGPVRHYAEYPKPLVKLDVPGRFHASGLEGGTQVKVVFREAAPPSLVALVHKALRLTFDCDGCGVCLPACPEAAIDLAQGFRIDPDACTACLACLEACPIAVPDLASVTLGEP